MNTVKHWRWFSTGLAGAAAVLEPSSAWAQPAVGDALLARPVAWVIALALLGLLPFAFMALTAFVKISTVLQIARGALGVPGVPGNTVVLALSAALTLLAMAPVAERIGEKLLPMLESKGSDTALIRDVVGAVKEPLREFLSANTSDEQRNRFLTLARNKSPGAAIGERDFIVAVPAFMVTELVEAFALGFALFLPFLVLDLLVANVLVALGMAMTNPQQISLPFKLLLFIAADGWGLLAESLVSSYR